MLHLSFSRSTNPSFQEITTFLVAKRLLQGVRNCIWGPKNRNKVHHIVFMGHWNKSKESKCQGGFWTSGIRNLANWNVLVTSPIIRSKMLGRACGKPWKRSKQKEGSTNESTTMREGDELRGSITRASGRCNLKGRWDDSERGQPKGNYTKNMVEENNAAQYENLKSMWYFEICSQRDAPLVSLTGRWQSSGDWVETEILASSSQHGKWTLFILCTMTNLKKFNSFSHISKVHLYTCLSGH